MKLRRKIQLISLLTFLVIAVFSSVLLLYLEEQRSQSAMRSAELLLSSISEQRRGALANDLLLDQHENMIINLSLMTKIDSIVLAQLYDAHGDLLAASKAGDFADQELALLPINSSPSEPLFALHSNKEYPLASITVAINIIGETAGFLRVFLSMQRQESERSKNLYLFFATLVAVFVLLSVVLNAWLQVMIAQPITSLTARLRDFEERSFLDVDKVLGREAHFDSSAVLETESDERLIHDKS